MTDLGLSGLKGDTVPDVADDGVWLACIECGHVHAPFDNVIYTCEECDGLLEAR